MIIRTAFMDWPFGGYSISLCHGCPLVHFRLFRDADDDRAIMSLDISIAELDGVIEALIEARNEALLRPSPPVEPTHDAPETTQ